LGSNFTIRRPCYGGPMIIGLPRPNQRGLMSSKKLLILVVLVLSVTLLMGWTAATSMARTKTVIHSVTGDFRSVSGWQSTTSTWYGPGCYGNQTASGKIMLSNSAKHIKLWEKHPKQYVLYGAANPNQSLPLGSWVEISYNHVRIVIEIADRGPNSRTLELMGGTRSYLDWFGKKLVRKGIIKHYTVFSGNQTIQWRQVRKIK